MKNVTDRVSNPFGIRPDCDRFVPGYGDANADFHVIGDHPGVHGGWPSTVADEPPVPFTGSTAAMRLQRALQESGLLTAVGPRPTVGSTYLSYLHACVPETEPTEDDYTDMERVFDAELRAIAAHVLIPVGERATRHVLETYTALAWKTTIDMDDLHATELHGSGWLVVPVKDPRDWTEGADDAARLVTALTDLQATDFRRESDLGRFLPGEDPYLVR